MIHNDLYLHNTAVLDQLRLINSNPVGKISSHIKSIFKTQNLNQQDNSIDYHLNVYQNILYLCTIHMNKLTKSSIEQFIINNKRYQDKSILLFIIIDCFYALDELITFTYKKSLKLKELSNIETAMLQIKIPTVNYIIEISKIILTIFLNPIIFISRLSLQIIQILINNITIAVSILGYGI